MYHVEDKELRLQKIDGISPCDAQSISTAAFTVAGELPLVKPLADACEACLHAWSSLPYNKVPMLVE